MYTLEQLSAREESAMSCTAIARASTAGTGRLSAPALPMIMSTNMVIMKDRRMNLSALPARR